MTRILITGASGFVGRALVNDLANAGHAVRAAMRQPADIFPRSVEVVAVSDLTRPVEWRALLKGTDTVVHLAGIAHAGPGIAEDVYDRVNRQATAELARRATRGSFTSKALGKAGFYAQIDLDQSKAYAYAVELMAAASQIPDGQEGMAAFLDKREPTFAPPTTQ